YVFLKLVMYPDWRTNLCPTIDEGRSGIGQIDTAVTAIVVVVLTAKLSIAPGSIMQTITLIERHPIIDADIVVVAVNRAIEIRIGCLVVDREEPRDSRKARTGRPTR